GRQGHLRAQAPLAGTRSRRLALSPAPALMDTRGAHRVRQARRARGSVSQVGAARCAARVRTPRARRCSRGTRSLGRGTRAVAVPPSCVQRAAAFAVVFLAFANLAGCTSAPSMAPASPPTADPARISRGAELAAIGDCRGCHTRHGGQAYTGGLALRSPFGT